MALAIVAFSLGLGMAGYHWIETCSWLDVPQRRDDPLRHGTGGDDPNHWRKAVRRVLCPVQRTNADHHGCGNICAPLSSVHP